MSSHLTPKSSRSEARILIVEDEAIEALDLQQRLVRLGYPLPDFVHTGEDAVGKARETHPDLILMDIMLSGRIDGIQAAEQIQDFLDVPIIFLTAYADDETLQRAKITEPYAYIVKPFHEKELSIAIDMSLYKHAAERKLKESQMWFSSTLKSISDAVIATDENGLVTFMNAATQSITGWKLADAMGKNLTEVFNVIDFDTHQPVDVSVNRILQEGTVAGSTHHRALLITRNGAEIPVDYGASPITDEKGKFLGLVLLGVVLVFRDVTESDRIERLKDEFLGLISHEIRTPLTVITGALQTMGKPGVTETEVDELLQDAIHSSNNLNNIVENMLEISRANAGRLKLNTIQCDFACLVREVIDQLTKKSTRHTFIVDLPEGLPAIHLDTFRVERILNNLIDNAIKYSPRGGEVKISSRVEDNSLVVSVSDQGLGISPENKERLFQSFERLNVKNKHTIQGIGLGLRVCLILTESHGGKIWVESEPGKGSTFCFTLPLNGKGHCTPPPGPRSPFD